MQSRALQQTLVFSTSSQRWPPNLKQPYPRLKTVKEIDTQNRNLRRKYSQTWANDHLRIATTCQQRPPFCGPNLNFYNINDLWITTTCQQRSLFLGPKGGRCTQVWLYLTKYCERKNRLLILVWKQTRPQLFLQVEVIKHTLEKFPLKFKKWLKDFRIIRCANLIRIACCAHRQKTTFML